jgi:hypothetical protein
MLEATAASAAFGVWLDGGSFQCRSRTVMQTAPPVVLPPSTLPSCADRHLRR